MSNAAFEAFWASYPRKVGKLAAQREWERIRPTPEVIAAIAAALTWQRATWDDPLYIPHPKTWLHQGRWMDEPAEPIAKPDINGHCPPCATRTACDARLFAELREKRSRVS